jgi:hypothetical protein
MWMTTHTKTVEMEEVEHLLHETMPASCCWPPRHNTPTAVAKASGERFLFSIDLLVETD